MKNIKKTALVTLAAAVVLTTSVAFAAEFKTPADIVSALTGKTAAEVQEERVEGKTYGTIAQESGKLDEFKTQMLEQKKAILDQRVKDGVITQERADQIYNAVKSNSANCEGTGDGVGKKYNAGFGRGQGMGKGGFGRMNNASGTCGGNCGMGRGWSK